MSNYDHPDIRIHSKGSLYFLAYEDTAQADMSDWDMAHVDTAHEDIIQVDRSLQDMPQVDNRSLKDVTFEDIPLAKKAL